MLLINKNYSRLWIGQAVSLIGDYVFDTTMVLWIATVLFKGDRLAPIVVAGLLFVVAGITLLVGPFAGVFVDRWDRRRTMLTADVLRAGLIGILAALLFLPAGTIPRPVMLVIVYAIVAAAAAAAQFFNPARFAFIGNVVESDADRARASGIGQATLAVASIVGPPLAAPLLFGAGIQWALTADVATFVISFLAIRSVRVQAKPMSVGAPGTRTGFVREFAAGVKVIAQNRSLRIVLVAVLVATLGSGALNALSVFFVPENLHADPQLYGTLGMGLGVGVIGGALGAGWLGGRLGNVRVFYYSLILAGLGLLAYARATNLGLAIVLLALVGVPLGALNTAFTPILLSVTPNEFLGRIMSLFNPAQRLMDMISVMAAGFLASTVLLNFHARIGSLEFGRIDTLFLGTGLLVAAGGIYAALALRRNGRATASVPHGEPSELFEQSAAIAPE